MVSATTPLAVPPIGPLTGAGGAAVGAPGAAADAPGDGTDAALGSCAGAGAAAPGAGTAADGVASDLAAGLVQAATRVDEIARTARSERAGVTGMLTDETGMKGTGAAG
jgi:hypothetical protein